MNKNLNQKITARLKSWEESYDFFKENYNLAFKKEDLANALELKAKSNMLAICYNDIKHDLKYSGDIVNSDLIFALEYALTPLEVIGKLGHCAQGGEQDGNQMHVWEAIKIIKKALANHK